MYGYDSYSDITPEQVLQKVSQEEIFEWLLGKKLNLDEKYTAPYREDRTPRCWFEWKDGILLFMDWGDRTGNRHKSCFGMVMAIYKSSLQSAVDIICKNFGISKDSKDYKPVEKLIYQTQEKARAIIKPELQPYNTKDRLYWSQYLIKVEDLEEDLVGSVKKFYLWTQKKGGRYITPYSHCYDIDFIDAHKIYQPYKPPQYRWITNCDEDHIGNFDNLPISGDRLFVQKAYKDHRVMRNLNKEYLVIWFQNEGCVPSISLITNITSRFKEIVFFYDNDPMGIEAAIKLVKIFNSVRPGSSRMVYLPIDLPKNVSDLVAKEGRKDSVKILNQII